MFHAAIRPCVRKRSKAASVGGPKHSVKFKEVRLYLVERKMGSSRRSFLTQLARSKGFIVDDHLSDEITHVVSEDSRASSLWAWLKGCGLTNLSKMQVLHISWFTDSMRVGSPAAVENRHLIQDTPPALQEGSAPALAPAPAPAPAASVSQYACQRRTSTDNKNKILTDAFEVLAEYYELSELQSSCLVFRRAASVLKSLPWTVQCIEATQGLPCLGDHTKAIMEEILQSGHSFDVERILSSERYQTLKLFTSMFGVGPKTAEKWYRRGLRSFSDIVAEPSVQLNPMQQSGFLHYGDISRVVTKAEAQALGNIIDQAVRLITSDGVIALTGGFRRGKEVGHDVDFIVTTHEVGKEGCVLRHIIDSFKKQGILLYCDYQASTFHVSKLPCKSFEAMDYYPKCFLILRLEASQVDGGLGCAEGDNRGWRAVRVDLVSPPMDRYAFALLGWTGSTQFDRDLRRFARKERRMILDNHTLYDKTKGRFLTARSEEDIFAHLGLEYVEPWQRNA
ncbi:DNA nucleotidylexotransferase isoform X1 [Syngnathus scovelli]|uniref:DNA nucleotidylexotransferase isoform X1 n=1 Tax=Syngnathus scovelli TaxID=161590 RepID=UPI0021103AE3|nr:DNA nucleotidylexotransferase isoform X1 [Syngnathus scovelli]